jgi:UDP-N-acetylmuramate--alanine ligase
MIFEFLSHCGRSPSVISGASLIRLENQGLIGNAFRGTSDILVIEADESDGTCTKYRPSVTVLLNISKDHKSVEETTGILGLLAQNSEFVIANSDDAALKSIRCNMSFGIRQPADFSFDRVECDPLTTAAYRNGRRYELKLPGEHNAYNLLASLSVCSMYGCSEDALVEAAGGYLGVKRRFSARKTSKGIVVVDDYAHNPEKIAAAIAAAHRISRRVLAVFQPHGFGPLRFFQDELVAACMRVLRSGDVLILLPVYYAGGTAQKDITSEMVAQKLSSAAFEVHAPHERSAAIDILRQRAVPGDCIISMGARDPSLEGFAGAIFSAVS